MKKNILLIGGSHGIGLELAKKLQNDYAVIIASRTQEGLSDLNVTHISFDATKDDPSVLDLPETLHGFAYCPGSINLKPLKMLSMDAFREEMELNFFSLVHTVKAIHSKNGHAIEYGVFQYGGRWNGNALSHQCCGRERGYRGFCALLGRRVCAKSPCQLHCTQLGGYTARKTLIEQ